MYFHSISYIKNIFTIFSIIHQSAFNKTIKKPGTRTTVLNVVYFIPTSTFIQWELSLLLLLLLYRPDK